MLSDWSGFLPEPVAKVQIIFETKSYLQKNHTLFNRIAPNMVKKTCHDFTIFMGLETQNCYLYLKVS